MQNFCSEIFGLHQLIILRKNWALSHLSFFQLQHTLELPKDQTKEGDQVLISRKYKQEPRHSNHNQNCHFQGIQTFKKERVPNKARNHLIPNHSCVPKVRRKTMVLQNKSIIENPHRQRNLKTRTWN